MTQDNWEKIARRFHSVYEELAPQFGYETRTDTKQFDPSSPNGRLMIAVCQKALSSQIAQARKDTLAEVVKLIEDMFFASAVLHQEKLQDGRDTWEISKRDWNSILTAIAALQRSETKSTREWKLKK